MMEELSVTVFALVPGTGLEPASREAADFLHTTPFGAAGLAMADVRALDYAFAIARCRSYYRGIAH
ncbi:hypothetical protein IHE33_12955 (plasmid) [Mycetohabitans endofungorum]|uniref:hypothetical protein n=1 Tax=Mycetohabitans endofungorum TaxID=417203 RepID=UPI0030CE0973